MAVIFAVVGGGAIVGIATSDPYSDHSDYSNYGNYSNYSDAAERSKRRLAAKEEEVKQSAQEINQYKINQVNGYLKSQRLIVWSGETVPMSEMKKDGNSKINHDENNKVESETRSTQQEIDEIEVAIAAIDKILEDKRR